MKIAIESYDSNWPVEFDHIARKLKKTLKELDPKIEHIGSTAVTNLPAKPIIDIMVGIKDLTDLDATIIPMLEDDFIYLEKFNDLMPYRRFFIGLKNSKIREQFQQIYSKNKMIPHNDLHQHKLTHIHIWKYNSPHWIRHLAFREYLKHHPLVANNYGELKKKLSLKYWEDGLEYNKAKDSFIKIEEKNALEWYRNRYNK